MAAFHEVAATVIFLLAVDQSAVTTPVNQPPVLLPPGAQTGDVHDSMSFTILAPTRRPPTR